MHGRRFLRVVPVMPDLVATGNGSAVAAPVSFANFIDRHAHGICDVLFIKSQKLHCPFSATGTRPESCDTANCKHRFDSVFYFRFCNRRNRSHHQAHDIAAAFFNCLLQSIVLESIAKIMCTLKGNKKYIFFIDELPSSVHARHSAI